MTSFRKLLVLMMLSSASAFVAPARRALVPTLHMSSPEPEEPATIKFSQSTSDNTADGEDGNESSTEAATSTINERLMAELQEATDKEKFGARSDFGKKVGLTRKDKRSDEEMQAAIAEARNLNGVNPAVAVAGGLFGLAMAAGLWYATTSLGEFFSYHPFESDVYFVQRLTSVFRNVVMGLFSLASGFFGVTGLGILALGIRVAIGVAKGELDPTPIKKKPGQEIEMPDVWDLMTGGKKNKRGR